MKYIALACALMLTSCALNVDSHLLPSGEQKFTGNIHIIPVNPYKK